MSGMEQEDFVFLEALNQRGTVFLARQRSSGRILVARQVSGGQTEIFETLRAMNAKHVPAVRAIEARQDGTTFVYEDYIQGVTLRQRMEEGPPLTGADAVWLGRQLCQALAPLHRENIVHRDIKPENIVLGADSQVYLIDFGIQRHIPILNKAQGRGMRIAATAAAVLLWAAAAFLITVLAAAALKAVLQ